MKTSTTSSHTKHLVIPPPYSPATMPAPRVGLSKTARAVRPTVSETVWNLHCIIVNPLSTLDEVRTAKRRLLRLLKTSKFQEMIVPPLARPAEPTETAATKRLDSTALCDLCGVPISRERAKTRTGVSPRARRSIPSKLKRNTQ